jgi:alpha-tubulin suppressor-like RCC1 family protein
MDNLRVLPSLTPVLMEQSDAGLRQVVCSGAHCCLIGLDSVLRCWGSGPNGELGYPSTAPDPGEPVRAVPGLGRARSVCTGARFTCAVLEDGGTVCFGDNTYGQLGTGNFTAISTPAPVSGLAAADQVACLYRSTCVTTVGGLFCWGDNTFGQLGDGTTATREGPVAVPLPAAAAEVVASDGATCARLVDGSAWCWGRNSVGQVGDGTTEQRLSPARVRGLDDVTSVRVGRGYACAVRGDRSVWCWGASMFLGIGELLTSVPRRACCLRGPVRAVGLGSPWACALYMDGQYECYTPLDHPTDRPGWGGSQREGVDLASSSTSHAALFADGTVEGFTRQFRPFGQGPIPDGGFFPRGIVRGIDDATQVAAGYDHACALLATGEVRCWGGNDAGQLGDGPLTFHDAPVTVRGLD